jgi:hypothetical protein
MNENAVQLTEHLDETSATLPSRFTGVRLLQGEPVVLDGRYPTFREGYGQLIDALTPAELQVD